MKNVRMVTRAAVLGLLSLAVSGSALAVLEACSSSDDGKAATPAQDSSAADVATDTGPAADAGADTGLTGKCADKFGSALTEGFGRIDGVVYAIQKPSDTTCAMPNKDHVVLQVLMNGAVYRMVVNVQSDRGGDTKVRVSTVAQAMPAPPFEEGWHTGIPLDYANILGVHSGDGGFAALTLDEAVAKIAAEVKVGDEVAVYATSGAGRPESTHLVHRNEPGKNEDGAIVIGPNSASPKLMLFHFADQTF